MVDPTGFLTVPRVAPIRRPVEVRITDWREVYERSDPAIVGAQAGRCMDCGVPFCHRGCPLGNLIPEWNDLVRLGRWAEALDRLHATNNFPEFTGRVCPAPCEPACVLAIDDAPVTIKSVEQEIADQGIERGLIVPSAVPAPTGKRVAVIGSGPAGLAAAQQLTRVGHAVTVFERDDRLGGLLRYGIPSFKLDKSTIDRRIEQMAGEGTEFEIGVDVGTDLSVGDLRQWFDAIILAVGALRPREAAVPGRELAGVHQAMEYLTLANRVTEGDIERSPTDAAGKDVVVVGGGDTGADCIGTAHRQGARSVTSLQYHPAPPTGANPRTPWPSWPDILREGHSHEEGGVRRFAESVTRILGSDGQVRELELVDYEERPGQRPTPIAGSEHRIPAQLVLIAAGFAGPDTPALVKGLGIGQDERGKLLRAADFSTSLPGVFVAGDAGRGASLVVWAIAEGRAAAASADTYLMSHSKTPSCSELPTPVRADSRPL